MKLLSSGRMAVKIDRFCLFFQSLFQTVSAMHPQILRLIEEQEEEKGIIAYIYYYFFFASVVFSITNGWSLNTSR